MKTLDRKCNVCKGVAKIFDNKKWWCGVDFLTSKGICKAKKEKKKK
jgi:hypothetical protein